MEQNTELFEKIRKQFDFGPYPRVPIEKTPEDEFEKLYLHNLTTAYYIRNRQFISPESKLILDAGCGSGYKSLILAHANPGAKIVGVDISEKSVELAKLRLQHHGFNNVDFFTLSIEDLSELNLQFDYINCDEVLYLMPDVNKALQVMTSVLKPNGIIRTNLHSSLQRFIYYRVQKLFQLMGLMDDNPEEMEIGIVREIFDSLQDTVFLKNSAGEVEKPGKEPKTDEQILANYLLQGDKGYTIPELFRALEDANLELISMTNYRQWDIKALFKDPENLPVFLSLSLPEATIEEQLHLFELLQPVHRLLDIWCGHQGESQPFTPVSEWTDEDWQTATVHIHPQLNTPQVEAELKQCFQQLRPFSISQFLPITGVSPSALDITVTACVIPPLLKSPQSLASLVERWLQVQPLNLETLEPNEPEEIFKHLQSLLSGLEASGYVMLVQGS